MIDCLELAILFYVWKPQKEKKVPLFFPLAQHKTTFIIYSVISTFSDFEIVLRFMLCIKEMFMASIYSICMRKWN